jgi:hypothetical protein
MERTMSTERRWMKPMLQEAAALKLRMPWERGLRRQAMMSRREAAELTARATGLLAEAAAREAALFAQLPLRRAV